MYDRPQALFQQVRDCEEYIGATKEGRTLERIRIADIVLDESVQYYPLTNGISGVPGALRPYVVNRLICR